MTTTRPKCDPTGRYTLTEAARLLGVDRHTVKRWEDRGFIRFQVRKVNNRKFATGQQIIKCWEQTYL